MESIFPISHGVTGQTASIVVDMSPSGVGYQFANAAYSFNLRNFLQDGSLYVIDSVSLTWSVPDWQIVEALAAPAPVLTLVRSRDLAPVGRGILPVVTGGRFSPLSICRTFESGDDLSLHASGALNATPPLALVTGVRAYVQLRIFEILDNRTRELVSRSFGDIWENPLPRRDGGNGSTKVRLVAEGAEKYVFEERGY